MQARIRTGLHWRAPCGMQGNQSNVTFNGSSFPGPPTTFFDVDATVNERHQDRVSRETFSHVEPKITSQLLVHLDTTHIFSERIFKLLQVDCAIASKKIGRDVSSPQRRAHHHFRWIATHRKCISGPCLRIVNIANHYSVQLERWQFKRSVFNFQHLWHLHCHLNVTLLRIG